MLKVVKLSVLCFSLALLGGCASSCGDSVENDAGNKEENIIVPKKADNVNVPQNSNTNLVNGAGNVNMNNPTLDNSKVKTIDTSKVKTKLPTRKLPDNSEVTVKSVGAAFVETRKFNDHPQLDTVEKIINGRDIKYKVYLQNGKTTEIDESKIKDFRKAVAADFLRAVGVKPAQVKSQDTKESAEKVKEKMSKKPDSN